MFYVVFLFLPSLLPTFQQQGTPASTPSSRDRHSRQPIHPAARHHQAPSSRQPIHKTTKQPRIPLYLRFNGLLSPFLTNPTHTQLTANIAFIFYYTIRCNRNIVNVQQGYFLIQYIVLSEVKQGYFCTPYIVIYESNYIGNIIPIPLYIRKYTLQYFCTIPPAGQFNKVYPYILHYIPLHYSSNEIIPIVVFDYIDTLY